MDKHIGKDLRHFKMLNSIDLYALKVGDYFAEDTYSEVHLVTNIKDRTIYAHNITNDLKNEPWYYAHDYPAYALILTKLEPKE